MQRGRYVPRRWRSECGSQGLEAAGAALAAALIVLALLAGARSSLGPQVLEAFQCAASVLTGGGGCGDGAADTPGTPATARQDAPKEDDGGFGLLDGLQLGLDVVGLIPGVGEIADGANALISLGRGDYAGAALSAGAMIPFLGWGATGGKWVKTGIKYSDEIAGAVKHGDEAADVARRCLTHAPPGIGKGPGLAKPLLSCITPSGTPGGKPAGRRTPVDPNEAPENIRALTRENESADALANAGYRVEQNPPTLPNGKNPDYVIEGQVFDNYAPSTSNARNIATLIERSKVATGQADRIVLNLDDSAVSLDALRKQMTDYPIPGLKEMIIVKDGTVIPFFPFSP